MQEFADSLGKEEVHRSPENQGSSRVFKEGKGQERIEAAVVTGGPKELFNPEIVGERRQILKEQAQKLSQRTGRVYQAGSGGGLEDTETRK